MTLGWWRRFPAWLRRSLWPREESNLRTQIRSLPLYPLSYGAGSVRVAGGPLDGVRRRPTGFNREQVADQDTRHRLSGGLSSGTQVGRHDDVR